MREGVTLITVEKCKRITRSNRISSEPLFSFYFLPEPVEEIVKHHAKLYPYLFP